MSYRLDESILAFAAAYVILEKGMKHIKIGPRTPGDLVLLGRATKPRSTLRRPFAACSWPPSCHTSAPKLAVGGAAAHYTYDAAGEVWPIVLLGLELGEINSPAALDSRVVVPLRAAATDHSLQL
jgi:hypothetical protein